jgi:hypothetical protein
MQCQPKTSLNAPLQDPQDRCTLPGFGLPVDYSPEALNGYGVKTRSLFPTVLDDRDIDAGYIECVDLDLIIFTPEQQKTDPQSAVSL